ncbi:NAD(P)-dependent oxidoreductase [Micromonospora sp. CPCC 206060]|uniref:NAD(P)-dependent oxidoreductase n=1 Tax=Micromonospora sp. CPCC 206060 TaxID=3122406 RepID=UPI002FEF17B9
MTRIAFLGLGRMGVRMAGRLVAAGYQVTVWNRTPERATPLAEAGARVAATPAAAVVGAELVITMLTGPEAVEAVLFGADGAAGALADGAVLVDMSTIGPDAVTALAGRLPAGVAFADAPVQGSTPAAEAGELTILFGGEEHILDRVRPVLAVLGSVQHTGPVGSGAAVKLIVNIALCSSFALVGEALALGDRLGVGTEQTLEALAGTAVGKLVPRVRARLADPELPTQFSLGLAEKDLRLALANGARADGVVAGAAARYAAGLDAGLGDRDISALLAHLRQAGA